MSRMDSSLLPPPQGAAPKVALPLGYGLYPFQGIFQQYLLLNNRVSPASRRHNMTSLRSPYVPHGLLTTHS